MEDAGLEPATPRCRRGAFPVTPIPQMMRWSGWVLTTCGIGVFGRLVLLPAWWPTRRAALSLLPRRNSPHSIHVSIHVAHASKGVYHDGTQSAPRECSPKSAEAAPGCEPRCAASCDRCLKITLEGRLSI